MPSSHGVFNFNPKATVASWPSTPKDPSDVVDLLLECHERIRYFIALAVRLAKAENSSLDEIREAAARVIRYFAYGILRRLSRCMSPTKRKAFSLDFRDENAMWIAPWQTCITNIQSTNRNSNGCFALVAICTMRLRNWQNSVKFSKPQPHVCSVISWSIWMQRKRSSCRR